MSETATTAQVKDPVDQVPPVGKLAVLGVQHVLAFYAGAVVVPLVIASGLGLDSATTIHLINADLFTCGIASIIQSAGLGPRIGVRLPLLQGVTFTAVSPLIAIGLAMHLSYEELNNLLKYAGHHALDAKRYVGDTCIILGISKGLTIEQIDDLLRKYDAEYIRIKER